MGREKGEYALANYTQVKVRHEWRGLGLPATQRGRGLGPVITGHRQPKPLLSPLPLPRPPSPAPCPQAVYQPLVTPAWQ
jgi:hypothetical protein